MSAETKSSEQTKFSMIIPTYNRSKQVFELIETVLKQDYERFEIIVVDDGSTDDTETRFREFKHPKVTYYRKKNGERGAARNYGGERATGEYLNFFDSDDFLLPNYFREAEACVKSFDRPEVFAQGFEVRTPKGKVVRVLNNFLDPMNESLLAGNQLGCGAVFIRRDIFKELRFDEERELSGSEDWLLWLRMSARFPFRFWNRIAWVYVDHGGNSVYHSSEDALARRASLLIDRLRADDAFMSLYGSYLSEIEAFRYVYTALHLAMGGGVSRPLYYLYRSLRSDYRGFLRKGTLGTIKRVAINLMPGRR